jgi:hypothetical protein
MKCPLRTRTRTCVLVLKTITDHPLCHSVGKPILVKLVYKVQYAHLKLDSSATTDYEVPYLGFVVGLLNRRLLLDPVS